MPPLIALWALLPLLVACAAVPPAQLDARAMKQPTFLDGDFSQPTLRPYWRHSDLFAPVTLATYPAGSANQAMRIANIDCENEAYAEAEGRVLHLRPRRRYNVSYSFLFEDGADSVMWSNLFFPPSRTCDPCYATLPRRVGYPRTALPGVWYTWTALLVAPKNVSDGGGEMVFSLGSVTCGYAGAIFLDNFTVAAL